MASNKNGKHELEWSDSEPNLQPEKNNRQLKAVWSYLMSQ